MSNHVRFYRLLYGPRRPAIGSTTQSTSDSVCESSGLFLVSDAESNVHDMMLVPHDMNRQRAVIRVVNVTDAYRCDYVLNSRSSNTYCGQRVVMAKRSHVDLHVRWLHCEPTRFATVMCYNTSYWFEARHELYRVKCVTRGIGLQKKHMALVAQ